MLARLAIALEAQIAQAQHDARHPVLAVEGKYPRRIILGGVDIAFRQLEDEDALDEHRIVGIIVQRLLEIAARPHPCRAIARQSVRPDSFPKATNRRN